MVSKSGFLTYRTRRSTPCSRPRPASGTRVIRRAIVGLFVLAGGMRLVHGPGIARPPPGPFASTRRSPRSAGRNTLLSFSIFALVPGCGRRRSFLADWRRGCSSKPQLLLGLGVWRCSTYADSGLPSPASRHRARPGRVLGSPAPMKQPSGSAVCPTSLGIRAFEFYNSTIPAGSGSAHRQQAGGELGRARGFWCSRSAGLAVPTAARGG